MSARFLSRTVAGLAALCLQALVSAHEPLLIRPLAEKRVTELPAGTLSWTVETFASVAAADAAAGPWSLTVQAAGKVWLFTLGHGDRPPSTGTKVAEVGPIARIVAKTYLLRINDASGPPGSVTPVHSHPGSEAFLVLSGEQSIRSPVKVMTVTEGHGEAGQGAEQAMQVSSSGATDLHALVMFVVDADKPFSSPAQLP